MWYYRNGHAVIDQSRLISAAGEPPAEWYRGPSHGSTKEAHCHTLDHVKAPAGMSTPHHVPEPGVVLLTAVVTLRCATAVGRFGGTKFSCIPREDRGSDRSTCVLLSSPGTLAARSLPSCMVLCRVGRGKKTTVRFGPMTMCPPKDIVAADVEILGVRGRSRRDYSKRASSGSIEPCLTMYEDPVSSPSYSYYVKRC